MKIKFDKLWFYYFLVKIGYVFFAHFIFVKFSILGDTSRYYNSSFIYSFHSLYLSTPLMENIGALLLMVFRSEVTGSLFVSVVTYIFLYKSVSHLNISRGQLKLLLVVLSFPSICMWTSVLSKESIVFIAFCLISPIFSSLYLDKRVDYNKLGAMLGIYIIAVIKPQFLVSIISICIYLYSLKKFKLRAYSRLFFYIFSVLLMGYFYYIYRVEIYTLMIKMKYYFITEGESSTRNTLDIFDYPNSFLTSIPYGFYLSFFGPNLTEALNKYIFLVFYIESSLVLIYICYLYRWIIDKNKLRVDYVFVLFVGMFLLMLAHYPFGVYNPGSAIRYRANFLYYIFFIGFLLREKFKKSE